LANGLRVSVVKTHPEFHAAAASGASDAAQQAALIRPLANRQGGPDSGISLLSQHDIVSRAHAMGTSVSRLARQAASALRRPKGAASRSGVAGLRLALACLDEDDDEQVALLTPVEGRLHDAGELSDMLGRASNPEELAELLKDVLEDQDVLPTDPKALWDMLLGIRHDVPRLMEILARVQGIPRPIEDREALRQQLADQLQELELSSEGAREASRFRVAGVAATEKNPAVFFNAFEQVKAAEKGSWVHQMQSLLATYSPQALPGALLNLIHALGLEMEAVRDATDKIRLGTAAAQLQQVYKMRTLLDELQVLADQTSRIMDLPKRERGRESIH
jgi:hypothetical protein